MTATLPPATVDFELPDELIAVEPPEARGVSRDCVRLMVVRGRRARPARSNASRTNGVVAAKKVQRADQRLAINAARQQRGCSTRADFISQQRSRSNNHHSQAHTTVESRCRRVRYRRG